ncbi:hypothetical protein F183_A07790 [Bryobacterales bacterium F-183]|nr:hypothetical protein F183_A07790 [Bryobacterales bacterium F-183]
MRIGSVSACINGPSREWIHLWKHNDWGYYDTPAVAWTIVNELPDAADFRLFAYSLLLAYFDPEGSHPIELAPGEPPAEPLDASFCTIGFDVVSRSISSYFECSPLSCNGMANEVAEINEHCLLATQEAAVAFAHRCAKEQPEPGRYYVLQVFEQRQSETPVQ